MAYKKNYKKGNQQKPKYSELEKLAFNMGKIARGLKNTNSRVHDSYNNGLTGKTTNNKKPLI